MHRTIKWNPTPALGGSILDITWGLAEYLSFSCMISYSQQGSMKANVCRIVGVKLGVFNMDLNC